MFLERVSDLIQEFLNLAKMRIKILSTESAGSELSPK